MQEAKVEPRVTPVAAAVAARRELAEEEAKGRAPAPVEHIPPALLTDVARSRQAAAEARALGDSKQKHGA